MQRIDPGVFNIEYGANIQINYCFNKKYMRFLETVT